MQKLVIYGCGAAGKYVYKNITNSQIDIQIVCWIDNFVKSSVAMVENLPVYTEEEFIEVYDNEMVLISIQDEVVASECIASLLNNGIEDIYILDSHVFQGEYPIIEEGQISSNYIFKYSEKKPVLGYLEYQVADDCNLKCRSCSHYSNLVVDKKFVDVKTFEKELQYLKSKFSNIAVFRLMGGEPLLNENLADLVMILHRSFPLSDIRIVSNGLRVPKISSKLIKAVNLSSATFDISQYPPTRAILPTIMATFERNDINYNITSLIKSFHKTMSLGEEDYKDIFFNHCIINHYCKFLRGGMLYACAQIPLLFEMKKYFGFSISEEEFEKNGIKLDSNLSGWDMLCRLQQPFTLCRFCSSSHTESEWKNGKPEDASVKDWIATID